MYKHKYHFFSIITNPNTKTEAKVKFFFDCLAIAYHFTYECGHYDFPCENHRTIITSIYYQIKHNRAKYAIKNIEFFMGYLKKYSSEFRIFDYDTKCLKELNDYLSDLCNKDNSLKPNFERFEKPLESLLSELDKTYFTKCLDTIINHLVSDEDLDATSNNHSTLECIFRHTKLLAVDFFLTGAGPTDINRIIENITNKDPKDERNIKHLKNVKGDIDEYYKNVSLRDQLNEIEAVYQYFKSDKRVTFFIKSRYVIENEIDIKLFGVHITKNKPEYFDPNFGKKIIDEHTIFATLTMPNNHANTIKLAKEKIQLVINFLNKNSENKYILDFDSYQSEDIGSTSPNKKVTIDNDEYNNKIYENYREGKEISDCKIDKFILENDIHFFAGIQSFKKSEILINLWFYFESYFEQGAGAIEKVSNLLCEKMKKEFEYSLCDFIQCSYFNYGLNKRSCIDDNERDEFIRLETEVEKIKYFKKNFKHPVLSKLIKLENGKNQEQEKFRTFLKDYLTNVYINRNLHVHALIENQLFTNNLNLLLIIAIYFRQNLVSQALELK